MQLSHIIHFQNEYLKGSQAAFTSDLIKIKQV